MLIIFFILLTTMERQVKTRYRQTSLVKRPPIVYGYIVDRVLCVFWQFLYLSRTEKKKVFGKVSAQPHPTLCIQFLDRENNDKNNTIPLGKQIYFTMVWSYAEILPGFLLWHIRFRKIKQQENSQGVWSSLSRTRMGGTKGKLVTKPQVSPFQGWHF